MASYIIDKRILHVANVYAEYENASPAQIMKQAHDRIRERFFRIADGQAGIGAGSDIEAQKLNEFFQAIKIYQRNAESDMLDDAKRTIIMNVLAASRALRREHNKQYFLETIDSNKKKQGDAAEKDIATIMQAVFNEVSGGSGDFNNLILGDAYVNIGDGVEFNPANIDKIAVEMSRNGAKKIYNKIMSNQIDNKFTQVQGKIDVTGTMATVTVEVGASPYLAEIAELLNKASFSIKSYSSKSFDQELKRLIDSKVTKLHLGHTNQKRILQDVLGAAGIPNKVSLSMYYYAKKTRNRTVKKEASRLIFIYELTGYGQKYVNNAIQSVLSELGVNGANYFIYNDPATQDIHVVSTAKLIKDMWEHVDDLLEKGATTLEKALFNSI